MYHSDVKIGNISIDINREPTTINPVFEEFSGYYFYYSDSISGDINISGNDIGFTVNSSNTGGISASVNYSMQENTIVEQWTTIIDEDDNEITNKQEISYSDTVCNYWSRSGYATVSLNVPEGLPDDKYYALVKMEIVRQ